MNRTTKLLLDILLGAVAPIVVLNTLTERIGTVPAYILAGMIPVAWVVIDLLFITRRFNVITSFIGLSAMVSAGLTFWFVDGYRFALKDSVPLLVRLLAFGGSLLVGKPLLNAFFVQATQPQNDAQETAMHHLLREPSVHRSIVLGTVIIAIEAALAGIANFLLNLSIVTAPFGSPEFNTQIAYTNGITRFALGIPTFLAMGAAIWLVYRAVYRELPSEGDKPQLESDFWELMRLREEQGRQHA